MANGDERYALRDGYAWLLLAKEFIYGIASPLVLIGKKHRCGWAISRTISCARGSRGMITRSNVGVEMHRHSKEPYSRSQLALGSNAWLEPQTSMQNYLKRHDGRLEKHDRDE